MKTWEYRIFYVAHREIDELNRLGAQGWEIAQATYDKYESWNIILRRSSDRYCEYCARTATTMDNLEKLVP